MDSVHSDSAHSDSIHPNERMRTPWTHLSSQYRKKLHPKSQPQPVSKPSPVERFQKLQASSSAEPSGRHPSPKQSFNVPNNNVPNNLGQESLDDWLPRVLYFIRELYASHPLSTVQETVFCRAWFGQTYREIADQLGYDRIYVRAVGAQLWQSLSEKLNRRIAKNNFRTLLQQEVMACGATEEVPQGCISLLLCCSSRRDTAVTDGVAAETTSSEPFADQSSGQFSGQSLGQSSAPVSAHIAQDWMLRGEDSYIKRPPLEERCFEAIAQPGALIRVKAPKQLGKTALINQVLARATAQSFHTVSLSFELADGEIFASLDRFLQWFCAIVEDQLNLPSQLGTLWKPVFGSNYNCTNYFARHILANLEQPLVLALDDIDLIFQHSDIAADFLGLLRAWCEKAKQIGAEPAWQRLRLMVAHAEEVSIPLQHHQSPFNIGLSVDLVDLSLGQVLLLAQCYGLILDSTEAASLRSLVGGKPQLLKLAFLAMGRGMSLEQLMADAIAHGGIYQAHLRSQMRRLQQHPELLPLLAQVMDVGHGRSAIAASGTAKTRPEPPQAKYDDPGALSLEGLQCVQNRLAHNSRLESFGWVRLEDHQLQPSCTLYQHYFHDMLGAALAEQSEHHSSGPSPC